MPHPTVTLFNQTNTGMKYAYQSSPHFYNSNEYGLYAGVSSKSSYIIFKYTRIQI